MGKASRRKTNKTMPLLLDTVNNILQKLPRPSHENFLIQGNMPQTEKISHALAELLKSTIPPDCFRRMTNAA